MSVYAYIKIVSLQLKAKAHPFYVIAHLSIKKVQLSSRLDQIEGKTESYDLSKTKGLKTKKQTLKSKKNDDEGLKNQA